MPPSFARWIGKTVNMETLATTTSTALQQVLEPLGRSLNVEAARSILAIEIDPATQSRIQELANRSNEGLLTDEERAEYRGYVEGAEILALLKLKARRHLAEHGTAG
ncbi:hypothetical protein BH23PLA1_BH23PLA1_10600 [soil metagenome]